MERTTNRFNLQENDFIGINIVKKVVRILIKQDNITCLQIGSLGKALYALEQLPLSTAGACYYFGIDYNYFHENVEINRYISFSISDRLLGISKGGSVFDTVEKENFSNSQWYFTIEGQRECCLDIFDIEQEVERYLELGAIITVDDKSDNRNDKYCKDIIISAFAERACEIICNKVIRQLKLSKTTMLSGDDTPLENTWDEICVQVQYEESVFWDSYLDVAFSLIKSELKKLDNETQNAIWLQTRSGCDWVNDCEMCDDIDFDEEEVLEYLLHNYVLSAASSFTNKRIEKYLYNFA